MGRTAVRDGWEQQPSSRASWPHGREACLSSLPVSPQGIVKRDELVFRTVRGRQVPILMVTSGGYQKRTARIIADSILNLYSLGLIGSESPSISAQNSDTPLLPPEAP